MIRAFLLHLLFCASIALAYIALLDAVELLLRLFGLFRIASFSSLLLVHSSFYPEVNRYFMDPASLALP